MFANFGELLGGALLAMATRHFGTRGYPLAIVIVPSSFAAWELWAGWPVFAALNTDTNSLVRNIAATLTAAIAVTTIWIIGKVMLPHPQVVSATTGKSPSPAVTENSHHDTEALA